MKGLKKDTAHRWNPADFSKTAQILSSSMQNLTTVSLEALIKKYAETTLSVNRIFSCLLSIYDSNEYF
jgi:hypothetical protein